LLDGGEEVLEGRLHERGGRGHGDTGLSDSDGLGFLPMYIGVNWEIVHSIYPRY
jgi:hypothetical protein